MKEGELTQIKDLLKEMEYIKKQIKSASESIETTSDSVKGSSRFFPYVEHIIIISGIDDKSLEKHLKQLRKDMEDKIKTTMEKVQQAQKYIDSIPDADTRIILQSRFIDNMTWEEIESDMGISWTTAHRKYRKWKEGLT
jgi:peptidoglycan hydrolase CwlO-like protein